MKILYADSVDESALDSLTDAGHEVSVQATLTAETLPGAIADHDVLVVRSTKVTADTIGAAEKLGLIVRAGAGTDNIDKAAASARGIYVCNVPGRNAIAVAELTMGLLLAVDRRIADNTADLREGRWDKNSYTKADGFVRQADRHHRTWGYRTGRRRASQSLWPSGRRRAKERSARPSPVVDPQHRDQVDGFGRRHVGHVPILSRSTCRSPTTRQAWSTKRSCRRCGTGSILLNTSRGDVVNESSLIEALDSGRLRAGLDVWDSEPGTGQGSFDSTLAKHHAVVGTHHIGASTEQAQRSVAEGTLETIEAFLAGSPINCVNIRHEPSGDACLTIRHLDRVGVLAQVFAVLRANGLNVQQMQNQVFQGGQAAVASIFVGNSVSDQIADELKQIDEVLSVSLATSEQ